MKRTVIVAATVAAFAAGLLGFTVISKPPDFCTQHPTNPKCVPATPHPSIVPTPIVTPTPTIAPTPIVTPVPTISPSIAPLAGLYGNGIGGDELANTNATTGSNPLFVRFRAEQSSALMSLTYYYLGPPDSGYAAGTGGTFSIEVWSDDGTANHFPGTKLAAQVLPASPSFSGEAGRVVTFSNPAILTAGTLYHILWRNTDASPASNYSAVDFWFYRQLPDGAPNGQLMPRYSLIDLAHGYWTGSSWTVRTHFVPVFDLGYANGQHQGQSYGEASYGSGQVGHITGSANLVRERFTVSGGDRVVGSLGLRLLRDTGSDPLTVTLATGSTTVAMASIPAASVAVGPAPPGTGEDNLGVNAKWLTIPISATLLNGQSYTLTLSTASTTTYWAWVNRRLGAAYHYSSATYFADGVAEKTTDGVNWSSLGRVAGENDLQLYFGQ